MRCWLTSRGGLLSRDALARVLQSLLVATLKAARGRAQKKGEDHGLEPWPETLRFGEGDSSLGCDSLEFLWLSAAVNEMFHLHQAGLETELLRTKTFGGWLDAIEGAWANGVTTLTFVTSGTTGAAKRCIHAFSSLNKEIDYLSSEFGTRRRVVAYVPAHHLYGFLFCAMLPGRLGIPVVNGTQQAVGSGFEQLGEGDLIVAVPEMWQWLDRSVQQWPTGVEGVVSGGPCHREVLVSVIECGLSKITEVYGSSETGGIGVRRWPELRYRLMPQWSLLDPRAPELKHSAGFSVTLMDEVTWSQDDTFEILGRRDGAVQVGGVNVYPERVAVRLRERPGVDTAEVRLRTAEQGGRFEATIGLHQDATEEQIRPDLENWISSNLLVAEQPTRLIFLRR
jgi:long-chain acyl-CoA synthetase